MSMSNLAYFLVPLLLEMVDARHCSYIFDSGDVKYFFCNAYEYCCGPMCCRSRAITFYQMWYFWLMVFLTTLLCSGGGWWYRFRNNGQFVSPSLASYHTPPRHDTRTAGNFRGNPQGNPTVYPYPTNIPPPAVVSHVNAPPPPYYGPPPSYDAAVSQQRN